MNISDQSEKQNTLPLDTYDPREPYNNLPTLPPRATLETLRTLKKAIGANKALAELRGVGGLIPNQAILIRSIILQEAKVSSEIENIVTTNDKLYRAFNDETDATDPNTKEVLRYEEALWHGFDKLRDGRPLSSSIFVDLVKIIKQNEMGVRKMPGTQIVNDKTGKIIYTPPQGENLIRELLDNLSDYFYNDDDIDPLIKLAVSHYQFEAIHPFSDGNGRTGRVINLLYLIDQGLLDVPVMYLSRYIMEHKDQYYEGLRGVTENEDWEGWIVYILEAVEHTAKDTKTRVLRIRSALDEAIALARDNMQKGYTKELVELVFQQPYTRIRTVIESGIAQRASASTYLKELERIGILSGVKVGREMFYINPQLMEILTS